MMQVINILKYVRARTNTHTHWDSTWKQYFSIKIIDAQVAIKANRIGLCSQFSFNLALHQFNRGIEIVVRQANSRRMESITIYQFFKSTICGVVSVYRFDVDDHGKNTRQRTIHLNLKFSTLTGWKKSGVSVAVSRSLAHSFAHSGLCGFLLDKYTY